MTNLTIDQISNILTKEYGDADWPKMIHSLFTILKHNKVNDVQAKQIIHQLGVEVLIKSAV